MLSFLFLITFVWIPLYCEIIVYDENTGSTTITCDASHHCVNDTIYYAGLSLVITCNAQGGCDGMTVYCGTFDPPGATYDISDMDGGSVACLIQNTVGVSSNIYFFCSGSNVVDCTLANNAAHIISSTVECDIPSNAMECGYTCAIPCDSSNKLICHAGSPCSCDNSCSNIAQIPYTTTSTPTTNTPTTQVPTTQTPTTQFPTTQFPTTYVPTTLEPTTDAPTSPSPTTTAPTITSPTTSSPTISPIINDASQTVPTIAPNTMEITTTVNSKTNSTNND
eukprot:345288_1